MNNSKRTTHAQACGQQVAGKALTQSQYQLRTRSEAMAVHAASIVVARMMDGARPVIGNQ
jgi:hypothetical protein